MAASRFAVRRVAMAAMVVAGFVPLAGRAAVTAGGDTSTNPGGLVIGPGNTDIGTARFFVGSGAPGSFAVDAGSLFGAGAMSLANGGNGAATAVIDGAGTVVSLRGDGNVNRFEVGNWGVGSAIVSGGALLDARADAAACLQGARFCNNFIGNGAGSDGTLTVTGGGSRAQFLHGFVVGGLAVFKPPIDTFTFGTPGGSTRGTVNVLAGGTLVTERGTLGVAPGGGSPTGRERSFSSVTIDGAGSLWQVTGGSAADPRAAFIDASTHSNAWSVINITNGGRLQFDAAPNFVNGFNLTQNNGRSDTFVNGVGSGIDLNGGVLQVGRRLGTGTMTVNGGATITDAYFVGVGRDASVGRLTLDGAGTSLTINKSGPANTADSAFQGGMHIGRSGTGFVTVSNGARIDITSTTAANRARFLSLGVGSASSGTLDITGAGSVVRISVASLVAGGGPTETLGPYAGIGQEGSGTLNITAGGKLLLEGSYVTTDADRRTSAVNIGGGSDTTVGARGLALVRGAGSEISINGAERFMAIGRGPSSYGELTLADGGKLTATTLNVGRAGGVGLLKMDAGVIELTGQFAAPVTALTSTGFGVGTGGGTGIVRLDNGSTISIVNLGTAGTGMTLGGSTNSPDGDGSLTMAGASSITVVAAPGRATFTVGRQGSALVRMSGASSIDIGDGRFFVAREAGSDGSVIATGGSTITAGWVGIGRNLVSGVDSDGGTGTMVLNGATLNATDIVIGTNGFLGGSAGSIVASGTITNYGIFSPGSSPGTFTIDGDYVAGAGSRLILEVQGSAGSGFETDLVYFKQGHTLDLAALNVEFRFLGGTSPDEFKQTGGFDIDTFLAAQTAGGQTVQIDHALLANTSYSARADAYTFTSFDFSADGGATFVAVPVPEPGTWALMLAGGSLLAGLARRRRVGLGVAVG